MKYIQYTIKLHFSLTAHIFRALSVGLVLHNIYMYLINILEVQKYFLEYSFDSLI